MLTAIFGRFKKKNAIWGVLVFLLFLFQDPLWLASPSKAGEGTSEGAQDSREGGIPLDEALSQSRSKLLSPQLRKSLTLERPFLQHKLAPLELLEGLKHVVHKTRKGDTLAELLGRFGLSQKERQQWLRSVQKKYPSDKLPVGKEVHFYFARSESHRSKDSWYGRLKALEFELNDHWNLSWEKSGKDILFSKREKPYDVELKTVGGVVKNSLFEDGHSAGLTSGLLSQLADIFTWEIDLERDIQKGDTFKILYEEKSRKGKEDKRLLRILAAELSNAGEKLFAIYFEKENGKGAYYDLDGRSLARAFLRFPLEFTNISSKFSDSRFHPILKVDRPHLGVDFAAKRGTPIRAIGDGKILHAGWKKGGYGRLVEIEHDLSYSSRYAHLQGFPRGIRKGISVKKGDIIGYVGSSGRTTGPHLHFELYKDEEYIDPLTFDFPPEDLIGPALQTLFDDAKQLFLVELAVAPQS